MEFHQAEDSVQLIPESVHYSGEELPQHSIRGIAICSGVVGGEDGVIVEIILGRPIFAKFLTVSKEIMMISCICFSFFHAHIFPGESSLFDVDLLESNGE